MDKRILVRLVTYPIAYIMWGGLMWYSQIVEPIDATNLLLNLPLCNKEFYLILQTLPNIVIEFFKIIYLYGFSLMIVGGIAYYLFIKKDFLKSDIILIDLALGWLIAGLIYTIVVVQSPFQVGVAKDLINSDYFWIFTKPTYEIPSLHTAYSFLLALHFKDEKYLNYIYFTLAVLIPISTLIMGMHWVVDVITGIFYGYAIYKFPKTLHLKINKALDFLAGHIKPCILCGNCKISEREGYEKQRK
ncbi:phosphatase PAP2 family protein [Methanocaldococcus fervens]|uniref:Phosphoesterase PA-phosphatase related n=1 Tax=Methanocaldococcus fervens (strain DSM 4213 / JCM 15782 / AG86) TaxID=573064 RepID=C7P889_METFA|nr:phosphatase PAP2 family protein [Methanocaldococcus fervens]ACV24771.1 phosphoesterase PA-phosphatase related [Methanocaldococcus fervens AG86]